MSFTDRAEAGRRLAAELDRYRGEDVVVLGLPRGGGPVAHEVARSLGAALDVVVVRKLGVPFQPEFAMGAVGEGGARVLDADTVRLADVTPAELEGVEARERAEVERRARRFRQNRPRVSLYGRVVLIVDDGVATGSTARAACQVVAAHGARKVVFAVPVGAPGAVDALRAEADEVVCLQRPAFFTAVGQWYDDFRQIGDEEVVALLDRPDTRPAPVTADGAASDPESPSPDGDAPRARDEEVEVFAGMVPLAGRLTVPDHPLGMVLLIHAGGDGRNSPRIGRIADLLRQARLGTLVIDLLGHREQLDRGTVFDVELLGDRLAAVTAWLRARPECRPAAGEPSSDGGAPRIGYLGFGTGAAAALWAAARPDTDVT
ncbi:phosphoribosyltransferase family protein, partial [Saccharomonospora iraqiensis]|uniref:phosphoribosyltransferase family protein n=1 Tax=Saccharomonospora iraqiensis TaxID=52698 RepID=UPI00022DE988